ncbi:hypothetical protein DSO57_1035833 [Entomophthora muscae]|nr:hypothetical protein DSO57_1035833 [Entomophthora muscae]
MDGLLGKNDAYAILRVGKQKHKTNILANAGKNPKWEQTFDFDACQTDEVIVDVYDYDNIKDDLIGSVKVPLSQVMSAGQIESWYALSRGAKNGGEILLKITCV